MNHWQGNGHMDGSNMGTGSGWMPIWWVLGTVLVVALAWFLLRSRRGRA